MNISARKKIYIILAGMVLAVIPFIAKAQFGADEFIAVPVRETQTPAPVEEQNPQQTQNPVWTERVESCTKAQTEDENFALQFQPALVKRQLDETAAREYARVVKARQDVNKLIASTYNELRTQQIVKANESVAGGNTTYPPDLDFKNTLQTIGIAVVDDAITPSAIKKDPSIVAKSAVCRAGNSVLASVSENDEPQCVAIVQESRIITNQDDYIYEEGRRKAMDALFCYLGDWRHFPLANFNDAANCLALGLPASCEVQQEWETLGTLLGKDASYFNDVDGTKTHTKDDDWKDDQTAHNFCEGMRVLGKRCVQDKLRDRIKYETIDTITRSPRTLSLAPPQTWYTPDRCRVLSNFLAGSGSLKKAGEPGDTSASGEKLKAYNPNLKSLNLINPATFTTSFDWIDYYFGSPFGNPTNQKTVSDLNPAEYDVAKDFSVLTVAENNSSRLRDKAFDIAQNIIAETSDLRKLQYASGQGLRDATLRIGWRDFNWKETPTKGDAFLEKYDALDYAATDPTKPNKIYKPLPCYWQSEGALNLCNQDVTNAEAKADGPMFYFDTGIVLSPAILLRDKLQSAIQAQFDLARDTFALAGGNTSVPKKEPAGSGCDPAKTVNWVAPPIATLPAPWEDQNIDSGTSYTKESLIPYIEGNYFNALYNDVFQLYHSPFPIQLEQWFATGNPEPTYDSVYEKVTTELNFLDGEGADKGGFYDTDPTYRDSLPTDIPPGCDNFRDTFKQVADKTGVDACLLEAISSAESLCGNPKFMRSSANACGAMQMLPETATRLAGRNVTCEELISNSGLAVDLSAQYLKKIEKKVSTYPFDNTNKRQEIAAYNAGEGCVRKNGKKSGLCPSTDCKGSAAWECKDSIPQTKNYVPKVQAYRDKCESKKP